MGIAKWAAVAVTLLLGLANAGLAAQDNVGLRIIGPALAAAAALAVLGLVIRTSWGPRAVIAVGVVNLLGAVLGAIVGLTGWPIGLVLSGLAIVLVVVSETGTRRAVAS